MFSSIRYRLVWGLVLLVHGLLGPRAQAQRVELGLGLGLSNYKGDLSPGYNLFTSRAGIQGFFKYNLNPHLALRANLAWMGVGAQDSAVKDPFLQQRSFYFRGNVRELAAIAEYNFFNVHKNHLRRSEKWSPFLFGGLAVSNFTVRNNYLEDPENDRYSATHLVLPFGVGLKRNLNPNWNLTFEFGARKMFHDDLDGIVNRDLDPKFRKTNPLNNDLYYFANVSLSYVFHRVRCAEPFGKK
jgi:Domain of unknown function (DUF6089)